MPNGSADYAAVPLFDIRAAAATFGNADSFIADVIAMESSSWNR